MEWAYEHVGTFAFIVAVIYFVWRWRNFFRPSTHSAMTNALFAEHALSLIELVPENPFSTELGRQIVRTLQRGIPGQSSDREVITMFNCESRFVQLNIIAMAMNDLHQYPPLIGEHWQYVKNPFVFKFRPIKPDFFAGVSKRLFRKHGVSITISEDRQLQLTDQGLIDNMKRKVPPPRLSRRRIEYLIERDILSKQRHV